MPDTRNEIYENADVVGEKMQREIDQEIASAPTAPRELTERLNENNSTSPLTSGGDIDADWEEAESSGEESVGGENPTPDQSDTERNAEAVGVTYQDNQPIDLLEKMERRDRDRFELDEDSKGEGDMI